MQSVNYRELLQSIHGDSVDKWFESVEEIEMSGDTIMEFIEREVYQDMYSMKWKFKSKEFKRKGQAETAAAKYFRELEKET